MHRWAHALKQARRLKRSGAKRPYCPDLLCAKKNYTHHLSWRGQMRDANKQ